MYRQRVRTLRDIARLGKSLFRDALGRVALSRDGVSPELPETPAFVGNDQALARIDRFAHRPL